MKEVLLVSAAGLFILLILFRFIRGVIWGRHISAHGAQNKNGAVDPELAQLVSEATTVVKARQILRDLEMKAMKRRAVDRASYYSASGEIALTVLKRPNVAASFYLRALRNNPRCVGAFERLTQILLTQKKFKRFERTCWTLLSRLDDDAVGNPIWTKCWAGLATIYAHNPRMTERADAIRKMLDSLTAEADSSEGDDSDEAPCSIPSISDKINDG